MAQILKRADHWVKEHYPQLAARHIQEAINAGLVTSPAGELVKKGEYTQGLDCTRLETHLKNLRATPSNLQIQILADMHEWVAIDKPAGVPSHPLSLFDMSTVTQWAFTTISGLDKEFPQIQPTVCPHRLDTGTSGVLLVAKTFRAFESWRTYFREGRVKKKYWAWCWGNPNSEKWTIHSRVAHAPGKPGKMVALTQPNTPFRPPIREALTEVQVLKRDSRGFFLAEIGMSTGVTHQVRVHLSSQGFPLLGDRKYDPDFALRLLKPTHHQLRAYQLDTQDISVEVRDTSFLSAFNG